MSNNLNITQRLELRDASGQLVGFVVPKESTATTPNGDATDAAPTKSEEKELWAIIHRLQAQRDRLRDELDAMRVEQAKTATALAETMQERNGYHRAVLHLTRKNITFTAEEIQDILKNGVSLEDTIGSVEAELFVRE